MSISSWTLEKKKCDKDNNRFPDAPWTTLVGAAELRLEGSNPNNPATEIKINAGRDLLPGGTSPRSTGPAQLASAWLGSARSRRPARPEYRIWLSNTTADKEGKGPQQQQQQRSVRRRSAAPCFWKNSSGSVNSSSRWDKNNWVKRSSLCLSPRSDGTVAAALKLLTRV